jgi:hypothetical protein
MSGIRYWHWSRTCTWWITTGYHISVGLVCYSCYTVYAPSIQLEKQRFPVPWTKQFQLICIAVLCHLNYELETSFNIIASLYCLLRKSIIIIINYLWIRMFLWFWFWNGPLECAGMPTGWLAHTVASTGRSWSDLWHDSYDCHVGTVCLDT